jgi:hypothetical protein
MRPALPVLVLALACSACKGRTPNWVRADLPLMGEPFGPGDPIPEGGYCLAFRDTFVHVAEATGRAVVLRSFREDGHKEREEALLEPVEELWDLNAGRISSSLGDEALEWEGRAEVEECLAAGPKKTRTSLVLSPRGLAYIEKAGWVLAFSAVTKLRCEGGAKPSAALDYLAFFDEKWVLQGEPALVRHGPEPRVHAVLEVGSEPALAWATQDEAGILTTEACVPVPLKDDAKIYPPLFESTSGGFAVITRPGNTIRVRIHEGMEQDASIDATIDPGLRPLSVAAAWTGDRLGLFFGLDKFVGTGSLLQHVLVEVFPDGTVSQPLKVYTQQSIAENTAFTRHLCACFAEGRYALAWIADDGYSQDLYLQEVPLGGLDPEKKAWRRDFGEGYRALKGVALFPTPPQYVIQYLSATAHTTHKHNIVLTALPTQR